MKNQSTEVKIKMFPVLFFIAEIAASWEEWWTYDGISGILF